MPPMSSIMQGRKRGKVGKGQGTGVKSAVDFSGPTMANQKPKADLTPFFPPLLY
jgi:hypothetical protein